MTVNVDEDYFNRTKSPPKTTKRCYKPHIESTPSPPQQHEDQFQFVQYASKSARHNLLPLSPGSASDNRLGGLEKTSQYITLQIRQKEIGSPKVRQRASSSETIIHNIEPEQPLPAELEDKPGLEAMTPSITPRLELTTPGETTHTIPLTSPTVYDKPFLDMPTTPLELRELRANEATVTSHQSNWVSQTFPYLPWPRSPEHAFRISHIMPLNKLPPVVLKDATSASIPSISPSQQAPISPRPVMSMPKFLQEQLRKFTVF